MITKKTKANEDLYNQLFRDAESVLDVPSGSINTLDEYFLNMDALRTQEKSEGYSLRFSRMPVDEPPFAIDANTRQIDIPASFKKNGIAVIGDHLAEVIYFTIDRYYDTWDLLDPKVQVVAQWSFVSGGKTVRSGVSIIAPDESSSGSSIRKDAKVFAAEDKIMFGWPINNTIAQEAGSIKFSIRLFKIDEGHLVFNMNTIPTTVEIKNSLDFVDANGNLLENAIDDINLLEWRFKDGLGYTGGIHGANDPEYVIPLSFYDSETETLTEADTTVVPIKMDLDENGELIFGLLATGNGTDITYTGYYKADNTEATFVQKAIDDIYFVTEDEEAQLGKTYYVIENDEYIDSHVETGTSFVPEEEEELPTYYEKIPGLTATATGEYYISITNIRKPSNEDTEGEYTWSKATISSPKVLVPGPASPSIEAPASAYLDRDNKLYITITGSTEQTGDKITYTLGDLQPVEGQESGEPYTFFVGQITGTQEDPVNMFREEYTATVVATRNNASSAPVTATIVATYPTEAPAVLVTDGNNNSTTSTGTIYASITNEEDIASEGFTYQWYNANASLDNASDDILIEGAIEAAFTPTAAGIYYCVVTNTVNNQSNAGTSNTITAVPS